MPTTATQTAAWRWMKTGDVVDGDRILYICGKYMKEQGNLRNNKIVTTVMSNLGLYKALDREGIGYEKTAVGDKYVYENMAQTGNCLGGEQSGHIIFSKYATTGDGILTSLKIMEVMLEKKETLSRLASEVTILPQVLKNVRVADKAAALGDEDVKQAAADVEKALGSDGRLLLRQSGTGASDPCHGGGRIHRDLREVRGPGDRCSQKKKATQFHRTAAFINSPGIAPIIKKIWELLLI